MIDDEGMLYIAGEFDRDLPRAPARSASSRRSTPRNTVNPIVWAFQETTNIESGIYGTPGIVGDTVVVATDGGRLIGIDRATGAMRWSSACPVRCGPARSSSTTCC